MPDTELAHGTILAATFVPGGPKTKGSLDAVPGKKCQCCAKCNAHLPGFHMKEGVVGSKDWRRKMTYAIRQCQVQLGRTSYVGAVTIVGSFYLPVKSVITPRAGDLDKLLRNTLDAAQDANVYGDDVQVVRIVTDKYEATPLLPKGLSLIIFAGRV